VIDLHCHILPGLDDGARDIDDSVAMAEQARDDGIGVVCATPHIRHDHHVPIGEIAGRVAALRDELAGRAIDVEIAPGGELAATAADELSDADLARVCLGGAGGWVLLEPAPGPLDASLVALVRRLAERGARSIIAHPERHAGEDFEAHLRDLAEHGCLVQWTAEFIALAEPGGYVMGLAADGLVHLLGSDAHSSHVGRPVRLAAGMERLREVRSDAEVAWIAEQAPAAVLRGEAAAVPW
jgi:protein-tyrosine phosphatase